MGSRTAIDMHAHHYGGLIASLTARTRRPFVSREPDGTLTLHAMTASTRISPGYFDVAARLAYMDDRLIATQLLTFPGALGLDVMPADEVAAAIRACNDDLAQICRDGAGRFRALAGLPLADLAAAADELVRVRLELGLSGAILPGNYFLTVDDARRLAPVLAAANETRSLLMIHPGLMPGETPPAGYPDNGVLRASALNLQASLAHMGLTAVAARLPEAYPRATFQLVNLGGTLPFIVERMEAVALSRPPHEPFPRSALRGLFYDCASLGPRALELAVEVLGADRVMIGTDYPIFTPDQVRETLEASRLGERARALVLRGTALTVLDRVHG
jgi:predicted TIM-barrel fold metal-dependent hydrolase